MACVLSSHLRSPHRRRSASASIAADLSTKEAPYGVARLFDLDGGGQLELEVVGSCGAGPNWEYRAYPSPPPGVTSRIDEETSSYRIDVSAEGDDEKPEVTCTFFVEPRVVRLPTL